ncbi:hypothetical protein EJ06DRAFT_333572 [Trichodelitschia bisporula]|uniref:Secreted protein n=1 Tax=Trichodelitschia bisporula TaxID=703511 RepID=A0A6G1I206_9PEZI|nr:hypothetical protein EJ06DRAFT_333572 [Trichodelitschia bisporula]
MALFSVFILPNFSCTLAQSVLKHDASQPCHSHPAWHVRQYLLSSMRAWRILRDSAHSQLRDGKYRKHLKHRLLSLLSCLTQHANDTGTSRGKTHAWLVFESAREV